MEGLGNFSARLYDLAQQIWRQTLKTVERVVVAWVCILFVAIVFYLALPLLPISEWKADKDLPAWIQAFGSIFAVVAAFLVTYMQTSLTRSAADRGRREERRERLVSILWLVNEMSGFLQKVQVGLDLTLGVDPNGPHQQNGQGAHGFLGRMVSTMYFEDDFLPMYEMFRATPINEFGNAAQWLKFVDQNLRQVPSLVQNIRNALSVQANLDQIREGVEHQLNQLKGCGDRLNDLAGEPVVTTMMRLKRNP